MYACALAVCGAKRNKLRGQGIAEKDLPPASFNDLDPGVVCQLPGILQSLIPCAQGMKTDRSGMPHSLYSMIKNLVPRGTPHSAIADAASAAMHERAAMQQRDLLEAQVVQKRDSLFPTLAINLVGKWLCARLRCATEATALVSTRRMQPNR